MFNFDLIVLGGGPAGFIASLIAQRNGARVALLERSDFSISRPGEHLSPDVIQKLRELAVWQPHESEYEECCAIQSAWGNHELIDKSFMLGPYGYGRNIDRSTFDRINFQIAKEEGVYTVSDFSGSCRFKDVWQITGMANRRAFEFSAPVVFDATGRSAAIAKHVGSVSRRVNNLVGIQAILKTKRTEERCNSATSLLIEAACNGWWYALRVSDSAVIATYMTDADLYAQKGVGLRCFWYERFKETIHVRNMIGGKLEILSDRVVPAFSRLLCPVHSAGYAAIGDAAMSIDPLSSQGIANAIDTAILAEQSCRSGSLPNPSSDYSKTVADRFGNYIKQSHRFYSLEQRWQSSKFWRRRVTSPTLDTKNKQEGIYNAATI